MEDELAKSATFDKSVGNRDLALQTFRGTISGLIGRRQEFRYNVIRPVWSILKRFSVDTIADVDITELLGVNDAVIESFVDDRNRPILAALCSSLKCKTFFEIGTHRGRMAWTVARNNPELKVFTLDLPSAAAADTAALEILPADRTFFETWDRGLDLNGTAEDERVERLYGDSATFDFSPYDGAIDLVFVDGSHSYSYVRSDTEVALRMLSPTGTIVWDDYPAFPGVFAYLADLSRTLTPKPFHIHDTRMVVYSRQAIVHRA